jgi:hypothetical protein
MYAQPRRVAPFVLGLCAALGGHLVTVAAMYLAGWLVGGGEDLAAGGRFAVAVVGMFAFGVAQAFLLAVAVPIGAVAMQRRPMFGAGLIAGWLIGFLTLVTFAVVFFYNAGRI